MWLAGAVLCVSVSVLWGLPRQTWSVCQGVGDAASESGLLHAHAIHTSRTVGLLGGPEASMDPNNDSISPLSKRVLQIKLISTHLGARVRSTAKLPVSVLNISLVPVIKYNFYSAPGLWSGSQRCQMMCAGCLGWQVTCTDRPGKEHQPPPLGDDFPHSASSVQVQSQSYPVHMSTEWVRENQSLCPSFKGLFIAYQCGTVHISIL